MIENMFTQEDLRDGVNLSPGMRQTIERISLNSQACDTRGLHPCEEWQTLINACDWMGAWRHIHTCPVCVSRAASIPAVTASVPRAWLVGAEEPQP